jgi:hypothetical protein
MSHDETAHVSQQRVHSQPTRNPSVSFALLPNPISAGVFCEQPRALKAMSDRISCASAFTEDSARTPTPQYCSFD